MQGCLAIITETSSFAKNSFTVSSNLGKEKVEKPAAPPQENEGIKFRGNPSPKIFVSFTIDAPGLIRVEPGKGLTLPNGLHIQYPNLRAIVGEDSKRELVYTSKGLPVRIYGGKVVENVCQAVARQVVAEQMLRINRRYRPVLTVHDSVAVLAPKAEAPEAQAYVEECMSWNPAWATGLPLACESGIGESYGDC